MANTVDVLGDDLLSDKIIDKSITELVDDVQTSIGSYAFKNCSRLTSVDFPLVTSISDYAFNACTGLTSVDFPLVTSIGAYAFQNCSRLTTLILRNTQEVATLSNTNVFSGAPNAIIYVPDELVDDYKAATNWSTYADRIKGLSELPETE